MNLLLSFLVLLVGILPIQASARDIGDPGPGMQSVAWLQAILRHTTNTELYGTAFLMASSEEDPGYVFVTNNHVLPQEGVDQVEVSSPLWGYQWRKLMLLGRSPGHDLAVFIVQKEASDTIPYMYVLSVLRSSLKAFKENPALLGEKIFVNDLYIAGQSGTAADQGELRPGRVNLVKGLFPNNKPFVEKMKACPAPLIKSCFKVPIGRWGFSGGIAVADVGSDHIVLGIISHFAPLSRDVYVIPFQEAFEVAFKIGKNWSEGAMITPSYNESDPLKSFSKGKLTLKTPQHLYEFASPAPQISGSGSSQPQPGSLHVGGGSAFVGGGSAFVGGGSAFVGGGSAFVGGGAGDALTNFGFIKNSNEQVAYLGHYTKFVEDVQSPETWGVPGSEVGRFLAVVPTFRGAVDLINYRPGLEISEGGESQKIYYADDVPLDFPGMLRFAVDRNPNPKFSPTFKVEPLPKRLICQDFGVFHSVYLKHSKSAKQVASELSSGEINSVDHGFNPRGDFQKLVAEHGKSGDIDVLLSNGLAMPPFATRTAKLLVTDIQVSLDFSTAGGRMARVSLPQGVGLRQLGPNYYYYSGRIDIDDPLFDPEQKSSLDIPPYGLFTVTRNYFTNKYEVQMILARPYKHRKNYFPDGTPAVGFFADDGYSFFSVTIPLVAAD